MDLWPENEESLREWNVYLKGGWSMGQMGICNSISVYMLHPTLLSGKCLILPKLNFSHSTGVPITRARGQLRGSSASLWNTPGISYFSCVQYVSFSHPSSRVHWFVSLLNSIFLWNHQLKKLLSLMLSHKDVLWLKPDPGCRSAVVSSRNTNRAISIKKKHSSSHQRLGGLIIQVLPYLQARI